MLKQDPGATRPMNWPDASLCGPPDSAAQAKMWSQAPALFAECWSTAMSVRVFVRTRFSPSIIHAFYPLGLLFVEAFEAHFPLVELDDYLKVIAPTSKQLKYSKIFELDRLASLGIVSKEDISAFGAVAGTLLGGYPSCVVLKLSSPTKATVAGSPPESAMDLLFKVARMNAVLQASARGAELVCGAVTGWTFKNEVAKKLGGDIGAGACIVQRGTAWENGYFKPKIPYSVTEGGKSMPGHIEQCCTIPLQAGDGRWFYASSDCGPKPLGIIDYMKLYDAGPSALAPYAIASYSFSAFAHELCHLYWLRQRATNSITAFALLAQGLVGLVGCTSDKATALLKAGQLRKMLMVYADRPVWKKRLKPGQTDIVNNAFRAWMSSVQVQLLTLIYKSESGVGPLMDFLSQMLTGATPIAEGVVQPLLDNLNKEMQAQGQKPGIPEVTAWELILGITLLSMEIYVSDSPSSAPFSENWVRCPYGIGSRIGHGAQRMQFNSKSISKGEVAFGSVLVEGKSTKIAVMLPSDGIAGGATGGGSTEIALARPGPGEKLMR